MRIDELELKNFRCFDERRLSFDSRFNVLVGRNGTGKSAILDALAVGLGSLFLGFDEIASVSIQKDDIRRSRYKSGSLTNEEMRLPVSVACKGRFFGPVEQSQSTEIEWTRSLTRAGGKTTRTDATLMSTLGEELQESIRENSPRILPLVAYYGTGRVWLQKREKTVEPPKSRARGYVDAMAPAASYKLMSASIKKAQLVALQRNEPVPELAAVFRAIQSCLPECREVFFDLDEDELAIVRESGEVTPFHRVSDGYKNMIGTVADIAFRCAALNPGMGAKSIEETPGVVLIDEIDLHLHPSWQRRAVDDLKRTFPAMQFIASTHSPFIVQSLKADELIILDSEDRAEFVNRGIEEISENVMGVENAHRSQVYVQKEEAATQYLKALQTATTQGTADSPELNDRLTRLAGAFSDDPAFSALLKLETLAAKVGATKK
jgi:predicted ATP-binding protein involved in virulence